MTADDKLSLTEDEWRERLTPAQFHVTRESGTEPAFTGEYTNCKDSGTYTCACCDTELFESETKYDSGSGWPSFWQAKDAGRVRLIEDESLGMVRVEVRCSKCDAHLGHLFPDGPAPTGQRYCINSVALDLRREEPRG